MGSTGLVVLEPQLGYCPRSLAGSYLVPGRLCWYVLFASLCTRHGFKSAGVTHNVDKGVRTSSDLNSRFTSRVWRPRLFLIVPRDLNADERGKYFGVALSVCQRHAAGLVRWIAQDIYRTLPAVTSTNKGQQSLGGHILIQLNSAAVNLLHGNLHRIADKM